MHKIKSTIITICLATAHPGKFPETIIKSIPEKDDDFIPIDLILLFKQKEHYKIIDKNDVLNYFKNLNLSI